MKYMLDFDKSVRPVWDDEGEAYFESAMPVEDREGKVFIPLYYRPDGIISVTKADLSATFTAGKDYDILDNGLLIKKEGSIPYLTQDELYPKEKTENCYGGAEGIPYILFGEGHFLHDRQIAVTYTHSDRWRGAVPAKGGEHFQNTRKKLSWHKKLNVLIYGDSIAAGGNASGITGAPPYLNRFGELFCEILEANYGCEVNAVNTAVGGTSSDWGLKEAGERAAKYGADLNIIAFGMNDGSGHVPPETFKANIRGIIDLVREKNAAAEFLLVTSILPNIESCLYGCQEQYPKVLKELEGEGIFVADVMPVHRELLTVKRYIDMTGNNVNHPADYLHRVYAQVLYEAIK